VTWPDTEGAMKTYLRAWVPLDAELAGNGIYFGIPKDADEDDFALVTIKRVGGSDDTSEAPIDLALLQIDVWGKIDPASGNGLKADCTRATGVLHDALSALRSRTLVTLPSAAVVALFGANVESVIWLPDADNDRPRYSVTTQVTATAG